MAIRAETKHSMLRRCKGWNYRQPCIYMITLVLADRRSQALGRLVIPEAAASGTGLGAAASGTGKPGASAPGTGLGASALGTGRATASIYIALSPAGEAVRAEFQKIGAHHPEIRPLAIVVMPDHVHFIIWVTKPMAKPLGNAIGGFKTGSSKAAIGGAGLWAEGFQDTILFHEGQLEAMFAYLKDNPRRLAIKRLCPELFQVSRNLKLPLQARGNLGLPPQSQNRGLPPQAQNLKLPLQAQNEAVVSVPKAEAFGYFSAIGNHFLLDSPTILQVQCSRSYLAYKRIPKPGGGRKIARTEKGEPIIENITPEFEAKRDELLAAAKHGATLISPCISDGEREIARLAFAANASVITLRNMGFSPLYKPGGKLFDRAANGKLLMLAPAAWPYSTAQKPMTRFDACTLNRIAQLLAGDGAVEINYKGMKPADVDRLVRDAVGHFAG